MLCRVGISIFKNGVVCYNRHCLVYIGGRCFRLECIECEEMFVIYLYFLSPSIYAHLLVTRGPNWLKHGRKIIDTVA